MLKTTRWSPDTCGCILEYIWDDSVAQDVRTHTVSKVINKCPAHASQPNDTTHYTTVLGENNRKNFSYADIITAFPGLAQVDAQGNTVLKSGAAVFSFDASRVLQVSIPSLTTLQKTTIQATLDTKYGANKIKIS